MGDVKPNPFRDLSADDVQRHLRDLTDQELINLLSTVSDDLKRRNHLLPRPASAGPAAVKAVVDALFPGEPRGC